MKQLLLLLLTTLPLFSNTWTKLDLPDDEDITKIYARNKNTIWVGGEDGMLVVTRDGGRSWNEVDIDASDDIRDIVFVDDQIGWLISSEDWGEYVDPKTGRRVGINEGDTKIFLTIDGGVSWSTVFDDEIFLSQLAFDSNSSRYIINTKKGAISTGEIAPRM